MPRLARLALVAIAVCLFGGAEPAPKVDRIVVHKKDHKLSLMSGDRVIKTYSVALGRGGLEPKRRQGDGRTPEGTYRIDSRNRQSQFHRSLHISYPSVEDRRRARKMGVSPGGDIFLHGLPNGQGWIGAAHRKMDWTDGCIAVTDQEIEEIWTLVPDGTPIEIRP